MPTPAVALLPAPPNAPCSTVQMGPFCCRELHAVLCSDSLAVPWAEALSEVPSLTPCPLRTQRTAAASQQPTALGRQLVQRHCWCVGGAQGPAAPWVVIPTCPKDVRGGQGGHPPTHFPWAPGPARAPGRKVLVQGGAGLGGADPAQAELGLGGLQLTLARRQWSVVCSRPDPRSTWGAYPCPRGSARGHKASGRGRRPACA